MANLYGRRYDGRPSLAFQHSGAGRDARPYMINKSARLPEKRAAQAPPWP
ncbi:MAG: hypothetical protein L0229_28040 [Blastocatellia bacterium]|nr:hypothetical protein [Blastocatellia bacterium]